MHRALRPYLTTGVAIVGASVIAVAPIQPIPMDMHPPNPLVQVDRAVGLAANEVEDLINGLTFVAADALVSLAKLPAPLVAELVGTSPEMAELLLSVGALVAAGPLIGGAGGTGAALQGVVDQLGSFDLEGLLSALIEAPFTIAGGVLVGGTGPNLQPFIPIIPSILAVFTGGLFNPGNLNPFAGPLVLPGVLPALQLLIGLTGLGGSGDMLSAKAALVEEPTQIQDAFNSLAFLGAQVLTTLAQIPAPLVAPLLGVSEEEAAGFLALGSVGLFGSLISGTGATGTALQDVVNSLGSGDIAGVLNALIGAPATLIDGVVNGGYGPNLSPILQDALISSDPQLAGAAQLLALIGQPFPTVLAGGLVNEDGVVLEEFQTPLGPLDLPVQITLPGLFATLQSLVDQLLNPPEPVPVEVMSFSGGDTNEGDTYGVTTGGGGNGYVGGDGDDDGDLDGGDGGGDLDGGDDDGGITGNGGEGNAGGGNDEDGDLEGGDDDDAEGGDDDGDTGDDRGGNTGGDDGDGDGGGDGGGDNGGGDG